MDQPIGAPTGYRIQQIELASADDALMRQLVALTHAIEAEARPEDPPHPDAMIEARFRTTSKLSRRHEFIATANDRLVGRAIFSRNLTGSNGHIREIELAVHPEHRRRGVGRALLAAGLSEIAEGDAKLVEWFTTSRVPASGAVSTHHLAAAARRRQTVRRTVSVGPRQHGTAGPAGGDRVGLE